MTKDGIISKWIIFYLVIMGLLISSASAVTPTPCVGDLDCGPCEKCECGPCGSCYCVYHSDNCPPETSADEGGDDYVESGGSSSSSGDIVKELRAKQIATEGVYNQYREVIESRYYLSESFTSSIKKRLPPIEGFREAEPERFRWVIMIPDAFIEIIEREFDYAILVNGMLVGTYTELLPPEVPDFGLGSAVAAVLAICLFIRRRRPGQSPKNLKK